MEHEEQRAACDEHARRLVGRGQEASLQPQCGEHGDGEQEAGQAEPVGDELRARERVLLLHAEGGQQQARVEEEVQRPYGEVVGDVEAHAAEVEGEEAEEVQRLAQAVDVARQRLHGVALRQLGLELVQLLQTHVAPLAGLDVLAEHHTGAPEDGVEAGEDVLAEVDALGRLAHTPSPHEEQLVEHVGVAVVEAHAQGTVQDALTLRHEALSGASSTQTSTKTVR